MLNPVELPGSQVEPATIAGWLDVYGMEKWPGSRDLLEGLRANLTRRWPNLEWRATKHYVAASVEDETVLGAKLRSSHVIVGLTLPESTRHPRLQPVGNYFNWRRMTYVVEIHNQSEIDDDLNELVEKAIRASEKPSGTGSRYYGVSLHDLVEAGVVSADTQLVLKSGTREITEAKLNDKGQIEWHGSVYSVPSARDFAQLLGPSRISINGWTHWHARLPTGDVQLSELRDRLTQLQKSGS